MSEGNPVKRSSGRPPREGRYIVKRDAAGNIIDVKIAQSANFEALAAQVAERLSEAKAAGTKLSMKKAVEDEIRAAIQRNNDWPKDKRPASWASVREGSVEERLATAYTEVRKLLAKTAD